MCGFVTKSNFRVGSVVKNNYQRPCWSQKFAIRKRKRPEELTTYQSQYWSQKGAIRRKKRERHQNWLPVPALITKVRHLKKEASSELITSPGTDHKSASSEKVTV